MLIDTHAPVTTEHVGQMVERIATAPFGSDSTAVPNRLRGLTHRGRSLGEREDPLLVHYLQHVAHDRQWSEDTTVEQYLGHLRRAVRDISSRLVAYRRRGGAIAAVISQTSEIIPAGLRGPGSLPLLVVIYSAARGILLSGYQASTWNAISIPEDARWLS